MAPCGSEVVVAEGGTGQVLPALELDGLVEGTCDPETAFLPPGTQQ